MLTLHLPLPHLHKLHLLQILHLRLHLLLLSRFLPLLLSLRPVHRLINLLPLQTQLPLLHQQHQLLEMRFNLLPLRCLQHLCEQLLLSQYLLLWGFDQRNLLHLHCPMLNL